MLISHALPTFLITLREGVEAALVVGIVLACLSKANQSQLNRWVYGGVGAGLVGSVLMGLLLSQGFDRVRRVLPSLEAVVDPLLNTLFCSVAILMLSWMLLWMTRQSRALKVSLEGEVSTALGQDEGAGWNLFSLVCIAVLREGFETVLFIFTNFRQGAAAVGGAIAGLLGATALGLALFRWGVRVNLKRFFQIMGILLLLIVGGLVISGLKNLDAAFYAISQLDPNTTDLCWSQQSCLLGPALWDARGLLPDNQFPGLVLKTLLGYRDRIYLVQALAYGLFAFTVGGSYLRQLNPPPPRAKADPTDTGTKVSNPS